MTCAVYRLYNARAELLYVGMANDPRARFAQHKEQQPWWPDVAFYRLEWHATRGAALDAEATAIINETPLHNIQRPFENLLMPVAASDELLRDIAHAHADEAPTLMPCPSVKRKRHTKTVSNANRTVQPSSWHCVLPKGHDGPHRARPSAHQAPWFDEEP